ncbi:MAG: DMT family transporter [Desulfurococcales archaeon]|jgi:drug/metabolite transporter (DMT)-like permease|nr:DMT family transporter [Desulfurococcales archaeon]
MRSRFLKDLLLAFALAIFWGSTYPIVRIARDPGSILLGRYVVASAISIVYLYNIFMFRRSMSNFSRRDLFLSLLAGSFNTGFVVSMYYALMYIPSGPVSSIVYTYPILILLISHIAGFQRAGKGAVIGSIVAFSGVLAIYAPSNLEPNGVLLSLAASIFFAVSSVISSQISMGTLPLTSFQNIVGLPIIVITYLHIGGVLKLDLFTTIAIIHQGVGAGYVSYLAWYVLIKRSLEIASSIIYIVPVATYLISIPITGEIPESMQIAGLLLILIGIYIAKRA